MAGLRLIATPVDVSRVRLPGTTVLGAMARHATERRDVASTSATTGQSYGMPVLPTNDAAHRVRARGAPV